MRKAYISHAPDASAITVEVLAESIEIPIDETYSENNDGLWYLIALWARHHGAGLLVDEESSPPEILVEELIDELYESLKSKRR